MGKVLKNSLISPSILYGLHITHKSLNMVISMIQFSENVIRSPFEGWVSRRGFRISLGTLFTRFESERILCPTFCDQIDGG